MLGCSLHCAFCQNWLTHPGPAGSGRRSSAVYPAPLAGTVVEIARRQGAEVIASSYNEPLITSEWAVAIFKLAQAAGMKCVYVSDGNATPEALEYLRPPGRLQDRPQIHAG